MKFDKSRFPHKDLFIFRLLKRTLMKWMNDEGAMMGAALAYYCLFSIAPMLMIALAIAGMIFGAEAAQGELHHHLESYFGDGAAQSIEAMLTAANKSRGSGTVAVTIGVVVLLFGASSVFNQLKIALNRIWNVEEPRHTGFKAIVFNRLVAIIMVMGVGVLLLGSIVLSAIINRVADFAAAEVLPFAPATLRAIDMGAMLLLMWILFAAIFRFLPDVRIGWKNVTLGAAVTSILFLIGRYAISQYLSRVGVATGYDAAGSILILLLWIYYSALIFIFGAELTYVYSRALHLPAEPVPDEVQAGN